MPHGPPLTPTAVVSPAEAFKSLMTVDPLYSVHTYYNILATCMFSVPIITGVLVKKGGNEIVQAVSQGFHDFSGKIGTAMAMFMKSLKGQDMAGAVRKATFDHVNQNQLRVLQDEFLQENLGQAAISQASAEMLRDHNSNGSRVRDHLFNIGADLADAHAQYRHQMVKDYATYQLKWEEYKFSTSDGVMNVAADLRVLGRYSHPLQLKPPTAAATNLAASTISLKWGGVMDKGVGRLWKSIGRRTGSETGRSTSQYFAGQAASAELAALQARVAQSVKAGKTPKWLGRQVAQGQIRTYAQFRAIRAGNRDLLKAVAEAEKIGVKLPKGLVERVNNGSIRTRASFDTAWNDLRQLQAHVQRVNNRASMNGRPSQVKPWMQKMVDSGEIANIKEYNIVRGRIRTLNRLVRSIDAKAAQSNTPSSIKPWMRDMMQNGQIKSVQDLRRVRADYRKLQKHVEANRDTIPQGYQDLVASGDIRTIGFLNKNLAKFADAKKLTRMVTRLHRTGKLPDFLRQRVIDGNIESTSRFKLEWKNYKEVRRYADRLHKRGLISDEVRDMAYSGKLFKKSKLKEFVRGNNS